LVRFSKSRLDLNFLRRAQHYLKGMSECVFWEQGITYLLRRSGQTVVSEGANVFFSRELTYLLTKSGETVRSEGANLHSLRMADCLRNSIVHGDMIVYDSQKFTSRSIRLRWEWEDRGKRTVGTLACMSDEFWRDI
jgi:hypothetical protein